MSVPGKKRVLILTYYWPPSGGAGVQRWLKFSKYLGEFGFEPVIYTAENPEYASIDESLFRDIPENLEVLKTAVWEPYRIYKFLTIQKKGHKVNTAFLNEKKKQGIAERLAIRIRGNWFIPDARKFWIKPSVRYLAKYLRDNPVDLIVSTGTPHSMHLIGQKLSQRMKLPWVADFRDPWTKIYYQESLMVGKRATRIHQNLEKTVIRDASAVTVVSQEMKSYFEDLRGSSVDLIPNGYDHEDFESTSTDREETKQDDKFSITHIGTLFPLRNPKTLWNVLARMVSEDKEFAADLEINLVGALDYSVAESIEKAGLSKWVNRTGNIPYQEAILKMKSSQVLLLLIMNRPESKGILTGKLFEYMNAGRPILGIGPRDGEVARVLEETQTGSIADFEDSEGLAAAVRNYHSMYKQGKLYIESRNTEMYSRKNLTGLMAKVFNRIITENHE